MRVVKNILLGLLNFVFRLSVTALVFVGVYRLAMYSYHFGYMVFADAAKEPSPGRDIVVTVENTENILDLGKLLKNRGLIEDEYIFYVQERLSDQHDKLVPGTYTLNTSMKVGDMLASMAEDYEEPEEGEEDDKDKKASDDKGPGYTGNGDEMSEGTDVPEGEDADVEDDAAEGGDADETDGGADDGAGDAPAGGSDAGAGQNTGTGQSGGNGLGAGAGL